MTFDKAKCSTPDLAEATRKKLLELVPECAGEGGSVDFDKLKQALSSEVIEGNVERYEFTWPGKRKARAAASIPSTKTLRPCRDESVEYDTTGNLYIEGDNLEVLKLLQTVYAGKVKMIYIDPPYNTGHDFIYRDRFSLTQAEIEDESDSADDDGNLYEINDSSDARYHSNWCSMMYPRLKLARNLLRDNGVIFVSIDDTELANLQKICDEIFGRKNFLAVLPRRTKSGGGSAADKFAIEHDYVIVYAKNESLLEPLFIPFDSEYLKRYAEYDEIGSYFWDTMERSSTKTVPYVITAPDGSKLTGKWFRSESRFYDDLQKGEVRFLKKADGSWSVQFKQRMAEGRKMRSLLCENEFKSLDTDLQQLELGGVFSYPKTVYLIRHLAQITKNEL